jgi:hypothetical protein
MEYKYKIIFIVGKGLFWDFMFGDARFCVFTMVTGVEEKVLFIENIGHLGRMG